MSALVLVLSLMHLIISDITHKNSIKQTKELSLSQAQQIVMETNAYFNDAKNTTAVLAQSFLTQRKLETQSRELVLKTLHEVLSNQRKYYAIFTMWEENAFDNRDAEYGKMYGQKTGRFSASAYWSNDSIHYQDHNIIFSDTPSYVSDGSPDEFEDIYYIQPKQNKKTLITEPYLYSYTKSESDIVNMSSVIEPVLYNDSFLGVVGIDIDVSALNDVIIKEPVSQHTYYSIISAEGTVLAYPDSAIVGSKIKTLTNLSFNHLQNKLQTEEYIVNEHYSEIHNQEMIQYFLPIELTGTNNTWMVMVEVPKTEIFADSRKLSLMIGIVSSISLFVLIVIIYLLANSIIKPIESIAKFARQLANGQLKTRINIYRKDELGELIRNLHFMAHKLYQHQNNLELLVKDKTKELGLANEELKQKNSELNEALQTLKHAQSNLLQSEKMASLGILTAGVAHEINNPLNYLLGAYNGLENYFKEFESLDKEKTDFLLNTINIGIDRITDIVQGLNQFSRLNSSKDEDCDIHAIIDNCLVIMDNKIKYRIVIEKDYRHKQINIKGNVGKLHQVFMNILHNAIQSIENKGKIKISTALSANALLVEIADNGCGIEEHDLKQIIEPFFTTKPPGEGTGLGLSISYTIIKEHNGNIDFESIINEGTKVTITLPYESPAKEDHVSV